MTNPALVNVLNAAYQLLVYSNCSFLMQSLVLDNVIEEFAIDAVFHNQK